MGTANYHVGALIEHERKKQNISQKKLGYGLCSGETISTFEGGFTEVDYFTTILLLQRLGKSPDKLEYIMSSYEYKKMRMRDIIYWLVEKENYNKAQYILQQYINLCKKRNNALEMFRYRTYSFIAMKKSNVKEAMENIVRAIDITLPDWRDNEINKYLISTVEMENLLLYGRLLIDNCQHMFAKKHLDKCLEYIEKHFKDDEEKVKVFPKCVYLLSKVYDEDEHNNRIIELCEQSITLMRKQGVDIFLLQLLNEIISRYRVQGEEKKYKEYRKYKEIFEEIYSNFSHTYSDDALFTNPYQSECHLDYEIIKYDRKSKGYSQEDLSLDIFTTKASLSQIENHKKIASKQNAERLLSNLDIQKKRLNLLLTTNSYEVLEIKDKLDDALSVHNYNETNDIITELSSVLDCSVDDNRRYIHNISLFYEYKSGQSDVETILKKVSNLLKETYNIDAIVKRVPFRNESIIINHMCTLLHVLDRTNDAIRLSEDILNRYIMSDVNILYNIRSYMLLYPNYLRYLCESDNKSNIEKSIKLTNYAIKTELKAHKTNMLAHYYTIIGCGMYDLGIEKEECRIYIEKAFFLNWFNYNYADCNSLNNYYKKIFGTEITF